MSPSDAGPVSGLAEPCGALAPRAGQSGMELSKRLYSHWPLEEAVRPGDASLQLRQFVKGLTADGYVQTELPTPRVRSVS